MSSSGAIVSLVSKGVQDAYLNTDQLDSSLWRTKFKRHTNFAQAPKLIKTINDNDTNIVIPVWGDMVNAVWFEGPSAATKFFVGSTIDLYIGGVKVDSQPYEYLTDIYNTYLADTWTKSQHINNKVSQTTEGFVPMHFFFCDGGAAFPICALAFHQVEIRITLDQEYVGTLTSAQRNIKCYANYVYLDTAEREDLINRPMDFIVSQLQTLSTGLDYVSDNNAGGGGDNAIDIGQFNHPVRSIFWGVRALQEDDVNDRFTFREADIMLNGQVVLENMSPMYFHTIQNYYTSRYGVIQYDEASQVPFYTRYYAYHFCLKPDEYVNSGSVNFSRLDSARLNLRGVELGDERVDADAIAAAGVTVKPNDNDLRVFALSWNVLHIEGGLAGLKFGA